MKKTKIVISSTLIEEPNIKKAISTAIENNNKVLNFSKHLAETLIANNTNNKNRSDKKDERLEKEISEAIFKVIQEYVFKRD